MKKSFTLEKGRGFSLFVVLWGLCFYWDCPTLTHIHTIYYNITCITQHTLLLPGEMNKLSHNNYAAAKLNQT